MFAEKIKSHDIAAHLWRVSFLYELPKVDKAAIFVPTLQSRRLRHKCGQDSAMFTLRIGDAGVLYLGLPGFPPVTLPLPAVYTDVCRGHTLYRCSAQLSANNSITLHRHGLMATCSPVRVSRDKRFGFLRLQSFKSTARTLDPLLTPQHDFT